jgi:hypothetical protein
VTEPLPWSTDPDALEATLRGHDERDWQEWSRHLLVESAADIPPGAERAWLKRTNASHRGIGEHRSLRHLIATAADQGFIDEISTLDGLERLELEWPVTASDLSALRKLTKLRHLSISGPRHVTDFKPLLELPNLRRLLVENAKHLSDAEWLSGAHHLEVIGLEGSIWTRQRIDSLKPFGGLRSLRGLFLTSVQLRDKDLTPIADCPKLEILACARFAPRAGFEQLQERRPDLRCRWFEPSMWA